MSARALCLAVRDKIRVALTLDANGCRFMEDGRPPAFAGKLWVSVHYAIVKAQAAEGFFEDVAVSATFTLRTAYAPQDQVGEEVFTKETEGLDALVRKAAIAVLSDVYNVSDPPTFNRANDYLAATGIGGGGFAVRFTGCDEGRPETKGAEWFSARGSRPTTSAAGLAQTATFTGARRMQHWEGAT